MNRLGLALVISLCIAGTAHAQFIVDTTQQAPFGRIEIGGSLSLSQIDYVSNDKFLGDSKSIDRTIIGGYGAMGMSETYDFYGALGLIVNAEGNGSSSSGTGFMLAGGSRMDLMDIGIVDVFTYAQLELIFEDYGGGADGNLAEIALGVVGETAINDDVSIYGALDVFPFSDGSVDEAGLSADIERDSPFSLRIGGTVDLRKVWLRGEFVFVGETSLTIGVGTYL